MSKLDKASGPSPDKPPGNVKRVLKIVTASIAALMISLVVTFYPKLSNMKSEYDTAQAIRDLSQYLRENEGRWPASPDDLNGDYHQDGDVVVDYSINSSTLIENPELLPLSVRPRSGKFLTYPYYEEDLSSLLLTLKETNPSKEPESSR